MKFISSFPSSNMTARAVIVSIIAILSLHQVFAEENLRRGKKTVGNIISDSLSSMRRLRGFKGPSHGNPAAPAIEAPTTQCCKKNDQVHSRFFPYHIPAHLISFPPLRIPSISVYYTDYISTCINSCHEGDGSLPLQTFTTLWECCDEMWPGEESCLGTEAVTTTSATTSVSTEDEDVVPVEYLFAFDATPTGSPTGVSHLFLELCILVLCCCTCMDLHGNLFACKIDHHHL